MIKPKPKSIRPNLAVARLTVETQTNQKKRRVLVVEVEAAGAAVEGVVISIHNVPRKCVPDGKTPHRRSARK